MHMLVLAVVNISLVIGAGNFSANNSPGYHMSYDLPRYSYTSSYTQTGNSFIERTHSFLKASLQKIISNHTTDWDRIAHIAAMVYNVFLHSSTGEAPFYLMFSQDAYMHTFLNY